MIILLFIMWIYVTNEKVLFNKLIGINDKNIYKENKKLQNSFINPILYSCLKR